MFSETFRLKVCFHSHIFDIFQYFIRLSLWNTIFADDEVRFKWEGVRVLNILPGSSRLLTKESSYKGVVIGGQFDDTTQF